MLFNLLSEGLHKITVTAVTVTVILCKRPAKNLRSVHSLPLPSLAVTTVISGHHLIIMAPTIKARENASAQHAHIHDQDHS